LSNIAALPVLRAWPARAHTGSWVLSTCAVLVAAISPFEIPIPGLAVAGLTLTTVEIAVLGALAVWSLILLRDRQLPSWRSPMAAPGAALLVIVLVTALAAPEFGGNSIKFFGRVLAAALVLLMAQNAITSTRVAGQLIATLLAVGAVLGALAVLELAQIPFVMDGLRAFRPGFHVVGGQVRATSTLFYPTITSMYLEVVFALGLYWLMAGEGSETKRSRQLAFLALVLVAAGIVATFTRAGLITMTLSLLCAGALRFARDRRWDRAHLRLAAMAAVIVALVLMSRSTQMLVTRMSTEGSQGWYGASYTVPETLELRAGEPRDVPVTLENEGLLTWQSHQAPAFALAYHWLTADSEEVVIFDGNRTPFAQPVDPGERAQMAARVWAPAYPGSYILAWDVVQEDRAWLSTEGVLPGRTRVTVAGHAVGAPPATYGRMPMGAVRLPRRTLWKTALDISAEHPLLGIGPDNYRHVYGRYLGLTTWDTRVHANNTYLEALVDMGIVGLVAVAWLGVAMCHAIWKMWPRVSDAGVPLFASAAAACLAIAVHGLVDSFFTFTPTYVIFALTAGLMFSPAVAPHKGVPYDHKGVRYGTSREAGSNAHRV